MNNTNIQSEKQKEERSEKMRILHLSPKQRKEVEGYLQDMVDNLNNNVAISLARSKKK